MCKEILFPAIDLKDGTPRCLGKRRFEGRQKKGCIGRD